jgi:flagellin-like protein
MRGRMAIARDGVSPVIGTILMVAVTVVLAAIVYIVVIPLVDPVEEPPEDIVILEQGRVTQPGPNDYDTFFTIVAVRSQEKFYATDVSFVVQGTHGSLITDATVTFEDADGNNYVTEGDSIKVEGMTDEYPGALLKMLNRGVLLGQNTIAFNV